MNIHIIESEEHLATVLARTLLTIRNDIFIIGITHGIADSIQAVESSPNIDLIFADIKLNHGDCFEVLDSVHTDAFIVFTGYEGSALKAFSYNCIDYIIKPITKKALEAAIKKFDNHILAAKKIYERAQNTTSSDRKVIYTARMAILQDGVRVINTYEICRLAYEKGTIKLFLSDGTKGVVFSSLSKILEDMDPSLFIRVSRTQAVAIRSIEKIQPALSRKKRLIMKSPWETESIETKNEIAKKIKLILSQHEIR